MRQVVLAYLALLMAGCGGVAPPPGSPTSAGIAVSAGAGCAADHRQGLVFAGAITGRLTCDSGQPICAFAAVVAASDFAFVGAIHGVAAGKPLLISFSVAPFSGPGTYRTNNQAGGTAIAIDGPVHWIGQIQDSIVVATANQQTLTGSIDSNLSGGAGKVRLTGTWVCDRVQTSVH